MPLSDEQILSLSVRELALAIASGTLTSVETLHAFRRRAEVVHHACNVITCWVEEAEEYARHCDDYFKATGKTLGPLHGIPYSIKDHFALKGHPATMGLEKLKALAVTKPTKFDSAVVIALRAAGAFPFCKTNMTQLGETWGGGNPAYGDSLNPWDSLRTTGGSSCGEGGLVGGGGSPFGLGSDVGGSVRIPCAFCGLCGLKPTAKRLTFNWEDFRTILNHEGDYGILATAGPMAKRVEDLVEVCAALWTEPLFKLDPRVPPMPLNRALLEETRPLRIGWYIDDLVYPAVCPSARRAVEMAKAALQTAGHTLVEFRAHAEGIVTLQELRGIDYALHILDNSAGAQAQKPKKAANEQDENVGNYGGGPLKGERLHPDWIAAHTPPPKGTKSADWKVMPRTNTPDAYQKAMGARDKVRDKWAKYWNRLGIDVLLCPPWPFPAPRVEQVRNAHVGNLQAMRLYNFLDYPAGVVPVTKVSSEDLAQTYDPDTDDALMAEAATTSVQDSLNLPVCVQLAAPPWREELCLRAMLEVQRRLPFDPAQHSKLSPVPRRSPEMGARPESIATSKL
mmetsp:Transcript_8217/g.22584  ORF Transcript_8217/g.22584 Transcript_8217/m.22584 type:complete len:566 (-) Transcript_8217:17-1714(-)